ncbi:MAG: hypothetical protein JWR21_3761 [Herminiimonas sp.]|nr:hypothetical protein [Herminiimonas sp.]
MCEPSYLRDISYERCCRQGCHLKQSSGLRIIATLSAIAAVGAVATIAVFATARYAGSAMVFVLFTLTCFLLLGLIAPKPRSYGYGFFAIFFFLGFWPKVAMHAVWGTSFLEAVGDFSGKPAEWDNALIAAACGALGVSVARILHLVMVSRSVHSLKQAAGSRAPLWYVNHCRSIWIVSVAAVAIINFANYHYAFYKIGVNPLLILPLHLNVVVSWLINIGAALWMVTLVFWDLRRRPAVFATSSIPFVEAFLSSTSAMSRGMFAFHAVPYFIGLYASAGDLDRAQGHSALRQAARWLVILFLVALGIVFWLRIPSLHGDDLLKRPRSEVVATFHKDLTKQIPALVLKRWIGLEGLLAVEGSKLRGTELFINVLTESPKSGVDSIFQQIAKVDFNRSDPTKTYLSNAGPMALLYMSDSRPVVFIGMFAIGLILIFSDTVALRWTGNTLLVAVAGAGLANVMAQTNFAYLTIVFLSQLWFTVAVLGLLQGSFRRSEARQ